MLQKNLNDIEAKLDPPKIKGIKDLTRHIKESVAALAQIKPLRNLLLITAAFNGILLTALPTLLMSFAENPSVHILSFEFTITVSKGIVFIFGFCAAIFGPKYCK